MRLSGIGPTIVVQIIPIDQPVTIIVVPIKFVFIDPSIAIIIEPPSIRSVSIIHTRLKDRISIRRFPACLTSELEATIGSISS
jgi:hypothetical protein